MTNPDLTELQSLIESSSIELPLKPEDERRIIQELTTKAESNVCVGNLYYIVSGRWFSAWQRYTEQRDGSLSFENQTLSPSHSGDRPGAIDNSDIIVNEEDGEDGDLQILRTLVEGRDYVLVPQEVWETLSEWYKGGPALPRKMISVGNQRLIDSVEVFPLCLTLTDSRDQSEVVIRLSKKASLNELYKKVGHLKDVSLEQAQIWDFFNKQKQTLLYTLDDTLEELDLQMDQDILLEVIIADFDVDEKLDTKDGNNGLQFLTRGNNGGLVGLQNLGNTCFMNSSLQCLAHTTPIVVYFLQDFSYGINSDSSFELNGELAVVFCELLRELWTSAQTSIAPHPFKSKLDHITPQFRGCNQQDSEEFLIFLLNRLHEDLNRVKMKPHFETMDNDGWPDEDVANELWNLHKSENDSIIVDTCQGLYKSTLVCSGCDKISITFDLFMHLTLPLPSIDTRVMTITVFYGDGCSLPKPFTVTLPSRGYCNDLSNALGNECCLRSDEYLLLAEVYEHQIYRYLNNPKEPLDNIKDDEQIVAYRLLKKHGNFTRLEICHRNKDIERKMFLTPLVTVMEDPQCGEDISIAVDRVLAPLRRKPFSSSDGMARRQLSLISNSGYGSWLIMMDSVMMPRGNVRVMLDWTKKEDDEYDSSCLKELKDLTEVKKQGPLSLYSCLDAYTKEEPLRHNEMWKCPRCKDYKEASQKLDLWRLPDILVFQLKRFSREGKVETFVEFPIRDLDMSKYVKCDEGSNVYEVYAITNHTGNLCGGHYYAYCKLSIDNSWYSFNDHHVMSVSESEIMTADAYLLFYQRVKAPKGYETELDVVD